MFDSLLSLPGSLAILAQESQNRPLWFTMLPWLAILAVMILVMILPQRKQAKKHREMLAKMTKNDRVLTRGGIIGVIVEVRDHEVILKVDESNNTRIHFAKQAIQHVFADKDNIDPAQAGEM